MICIFKKYVNIIKYIDTCGQIFLFIDTSLRIQVPLEAVFTQYVLWTYTCSFCGIWIHREQHNHETLCVLMRACVLEERHVYFNSYFPLWKVLREVDFSAIVLLFSKYIWSQLPINTRRPRKPGFPIFLTQTHLVGSHVPWQFEMMRHYRMGLPYKWLNW